MDALTYYSELSQASAPKLHISALAAIFYTFVTLNTPTINKLSIVSQRLPVLTREKVSLSQWKLLKVRGLFSQCICTKEETKWAT